MNSERTEAYLQLIQSLLNCDSGEEAAILAANQELVDGGLLQMVLAAAQMFDAQVNENVAKWLEAFADELRNALNLDTEVDLQSLSEEEYEAYFRFLMEALQATGESKGDAQVVYPLLQKNIKKLDGVLAEILKRWGTDVLGEAQPDEAEVLARVTGGFGNLLGQFPLGSKAHNMEIAITSYEIALTIFTQSAFPVEWAITQNNLGNAYRERILGEKAQNIETAIAAYTQALSVRTQSAFPVEWAMTQNNLGNAYYDRILGEKAQNIETAIAAYTQALSVYTQSAFPVEWAITQNNLGNAYRERILGEKAQNIETAIAAYTQALSVYTQSAFPVEWAMTQNNLGNAYYDRILGEKAQNIETAIAAYTQALSVYTQSAFPVEWAMTQNNLGNAYYDRILGEKAQNIETAIAAYTQALSVYTQSAFPVEWAMTQNNLGNAYGNRILGDKAQNIETAIAAFTQALSVRTQSAFPVEWAMTQNNLGNAYGNRILGDKAQNIETAIAALTQALSVRTQSAFPVEWAMTQNNLGNAYYDRILGDKAQNIETAIAAFTQALSVRTQSAFPVEWAMTQNNLGIAYYDRILGDFAQNIETAIAAYTQALSVYTQSAFPVDWAMTQNNLGVAYSDRILGDKAQNIETAIAAYTQALSVYTQSAFPVDWAGTQNNLGNAYRERILGDKAQNIETAIAAFTQALSVRTQNAFPVDWAKTQNNLGIAYYDRILGDKAQNIETAIAAYTQALSVRTQSAFPADWAMTQNNLGNAYYDRILGEKAQNIETAIAAFTQALSVRTQSAFPVDWAGTQNNLGNAYRERILGDKAQNIETAIAAFTQALSVRTQNAFPVDWAMTQNNLGIAYYDRILGDKAQNIETAIAAFTQALSVLTKSAFPVEWAGTQNNLGLAYSDRILGNKAQNVEDAIAAFTQALSVLTKSAFPQNHATTFLLSLGILYQNAERFTEAYNTYKSAIATVESLRGEIVSGDESKRKQAEEWNKLYRRMVEVCLQLDNTIAAIEYVERSKTRNLVELILERDIKTIFPPETVTQLQALRDEIATLQHQLQNNKAENPISLSQHLQQLRQQRIQLQDKHLPVGSNFNFQLFYSTLDSNTAIIEWYIATEKIIAFIILPETQKPIIWQSPSENTDRLVDWANKYLDDYYTQKEEWSSNLAERLKELAEILQIKEILAQIPKHYRLILVPHRILHLLPLHALPVEESYLLDLFPNGVGYAPSCQLLQQLQYRQRADFQSLFAIQTPTPDLYEQDLGAVSIISKQFAHHYTLKQNSATKSALLLSDDNSNTITVPQELLNANSVLFFCHGIFNFVSPLDSSLELADDNLTLDDIIKHFKLEKCRLVTLSACETGLTDYTNFSDEYIGLPSGFLLAGCANVVSSLWSVRADATALLMIKFYQELRQQNHITLALNTAQRWLRDTTVEGFQNWLTHSPLSLAWQIEVGKYFDTIGQKQGLTGKPFENPYYWSAFCVIGKGV
jgi:CHAT domain-containing protein